MRKFEIVTLRDWQTLREGENVDPITIITGATALLTSLFPGIFGGSRKRLTSSDWLTLLPGAGYWTTQLRNYLSKHITYDVDWTTNAQPFTSYFINEMQNAIDPSLPLYPGVLSTSQWNKLVSDFYAIIAEEKRTGGTSPTGTVPGGYGMTLDYSTLLPIAAGALVLVMIMKKKKKRR